MSKIISLSLVLLIISATTTANAEPITRGLSIGNPIAEAQPDNECVSAYQLAERTLIEQMPANTDLRDIDWKLQSEHALVEVWFSDTQTCQSFDIKHLERFDPHQSPREVFEEGLVETYALGKMIIGEHTNELGRTYYTVRNCPLCL